MKTTRWQDVKFKEGVPRPGPSKFDRIEAVWRFGTLPLADHLRRRGCAFETALEIVRHLNAERAAPFPDHEVVWIVRGSYEVAR